MLGKILFVIVLPISGSCRWFIGQWLYQIKPKIFFSLWNYFKLGPSRLQIFVNVYTIRANRNNTVYM